MTSLQQAAGTTFSNTNNTKSQSKGGGSGAFESCFASGLDLSEFGGGNNAKHATKTSAAAQLLAVKAEETHTKQQQEQEEIRMQQVIRKRTKQLEKSLSTAAAGFEGATMPKVGPPTTITIIGGGNSNRANGSCEAKDLLIGTDIFTTLVGMHGQDAHGGGGGGTRSSSTRKSSGKATRRKHYPSARQGTSNMMKKNVVKKRNKRSKH